MNREHSIGPEHTMDPRHPGLDGLRGLAILAVLLFHAYIVRPLSGLMWSRTVGQGAEGVGLFYIVSALTLAASWRQRSVRDPRPTLTLWARRVSGLRPCSMPLS